MNGYKAKITYVWSCHEWKQMTFAYNNEIEFSCGPSIKLCCFRHILLHTMQKTKLIAYEVENRRDKFDFD